MKNIFRYQKKQKDYYIAYYITTLGYKKTPFSIKKTAFLLEAGGFEPPSRDISGKASTCVVVDLNFASRNVQRQTSRSAIELKFRHCVAQIRSSYPTSWRP